MGEPSFPLVKIMYIKLLVFHFFFFVLRDINDGNINLNTTLTASRYKRKKRKLGAEGEGAKSWPAQFFLPC